MSDGPRKPFVGGNWKMNGDRASAASLVRSVLGAVGDDQDAVEIVVFPAFCHLSEVGSILSGQHSRIGLGAQDVCHHPNGAFTGEISVEMLRDCGVRAVLAGHSERRHVIGEDDRAVNRKVLATLAGGLTSVLCVGETLDEREAGQTDAVNERQTRLGLAEVSREQMDAVVIAYEPVWAIGTGRTATPEDAQDAHRKIRSVVAGLFDAPTADRVRIIYGGSMKPENAGALMQMPDIDGGLIGGASLKAADFASIIRAGVGVPG